MYTPSWFLGGEKKEILFSSTLLFTVIRQKSKLTRQLFYFSYLWQVSPLPGREQSQSAALNRRVRLQLAGNALLCLLTKINVGCDLNRRIGDKILEDMPL